MFGEFQVVRCHQKAKLQVMRGRNEAGETVRNTLETAFMSVKKQALHPLGNGGDGTAQKDLKKEN